MAGRSLHSYHYCTSCGSSNKSIAAIRAGRKLFSSLSLLIISKWATTGSNLAGRKNKDRPAIQLHVVRVNFVTLVRHVTGRRSSNSLTLGNAGTLYGISKILLMREEFNEIKRDGFNSHELLLDDLFFRVISKNSPDDLKRYLRLYLPSLCRPLTKGGWTIYPERDFSEFCKAKFIYEFRIHPYFSGKIGRAHV